MSVDAGPHSILLRPRDSDAWVASKVFGELEYDVGASRVEALNRLAREWKSRHKTPIIIDAGANVGYSALFFAHQFPDATVLAIEPDPETFRVLAENARSCPRIVPINAAVWKHDKGVQLQNASEPSWARSVADQGAVRSFTLDALKRTVPDAELLILKLDIEGAEREVCEEAGDLLRRTPCILIEPHDWMKPGAACLAPLFAALAGRQVDTLLKGENMMLFDAGLVCA